MATVTNTMDEGKERQVVVLGANETTPWYLVPGGSAGITCAPAGGTMQAQFTPSPVAVVLGDNTNSTSNSVAVPWSLGTVSTNQSQNVSMATAVRFIAAGGGTGTGIIAG